MALMKLNKVKTKSTPKESTAKKTQPTPKISEKKRAKLEKRLKKRLTKEGIDPTTRDGQETLETMLNAKISGQKIVESFKGDRGFTDPFGYMDTDPYIMLHDSTMAVFDLIFDYGTNRPAPIGWVTRIIPRAELTSGNVYLVERQHMVDETTENEIVDKKMASSIATIATTNDDSARESSKNTDRVRDMQLAGVLAGQDENLIDSDIRVLVKGKTPEDVEAVIDELMLNYKNSGVKGITMVRRIGEQLDELRYLFTDISADNWHATDMTTVSAGRLFLPSSGFSDEAGTFIGYDVMSLLMRNPSMIDMRGTQNAVIFAGGTRTNVITPNEEGVLQEEQSLNTGSAVAQMIANANYLTGRRTHHIVLNDGVVYQAPDSLYFDLVNKDAINPLEVFGTPKTVEFDANINFKKVQTMLLLLADIDTTRDPSYPVDLLQLLREWITYRALQGGLYTDNPRLEPQRAIRILATSDHENYPTLEDFITSLQANVAEGRQIGERAGERADLIYKSVQQTVRSYESLFARPTTLPDQYKADVRNVYYDVSGVKENPRVKGVTFLNVLSYVTNRALPGEMIVVHGLDDVDIPVDILAPYRERMDKKNIGLVTVFNKSGNAKVNPGTHRAFVGRLSRQDMVVLGGVMEDEIEYLNESWQQPVPRSVQNTLLQGRDNILYVYRQRDETGALIDAHLLP